MITNSNADAQGGLASRSGTGEFAGESQPEPLKRNNAMRPIENLPQNSSERHLCGLMVTMAINVAVVAS
ncbi:hypothetical protein ACQP2Y_27580 [Actinoplanes sp. CA-051413]|uniref:hypothetical protein n=1 Tax=Actinoplanes sp. CA-051413 TaxID=3239899 RepID=UPI003D986D01